LHTLRRRYYGGVSLLNRGEEHDSSTEIGYGIHRGGDKMGNFRTFANATRLPAVGMKPVVDPAGWLSDELGEVSEWSYQIDENDVDELARAVASFKRSGLPIEDVSRDTFPLKGFATTLADVRRELLDGRGMVMLQKFPIDRMNREEVSIAYLGLGSYLGRTMIQNASGHILGHVRDIGKDYTVERGYGTRAELRFHADGCDYVGLLCLQTAKFGGESRVASSVAVYNKILAKRPDVTKVLMGDFYRTNNGDVTKGERPWFAQPVFSFTQGYFSAMGVGSTIDKAQRLPDVPKLTPDQLEAIEVYRETVSECAYDMPFRPGDIQLLNNLVTLHSRRSFEDWPEPERKRHLLRLWLSDPDGRPIPEEQQRGRSRLGIQIDGLKPVVPLDVAVPA
jgi:hypothetical protein